MRLLNRLILSPVTIGNRDPFHTLRWRSFQFNTFCLTVLPMGWTNSPAILQGDVTHILRPEIPHLTQPLADDVPIKGPCTHYVLPDGSAVVTNILC